MRKRAQIKIPAAETKPTYEKPKKNKINKKFKIKKSWWVPLCLIAIFCLVLILNSYFNIVSNVAINPDGTQVSDKFYLSGPDPYYNMRLVEETVETGKYPYYASDDPMLNYPIGRSGGRAPLLNMMAIFFSRTLAPFMSETDAIGYSMQFIPALFGALIVFPVYFIGKSLFGKKEGLIAALFISIIPIHIGSGHGSAYALFDHDSFNLLLFFLTYLFLIKSIKEKDNLKSIIYALLSGTSIAALTMVWVEAQFIYVVVAVYAVIQILINIFTNKSSLRFSQNMTIILLSGYFISLPVRALKMNQFTLELPIVMALVVLLFGLLTVLLKRKAIPWILSLPTIFGLGAIFAVFLYFVDDLAKSFTFLSPLTRIAEILYGSGIYGNKVDITIAEAGTYSISRTVMSYGPTLYWLAWAGFVLLAYFYLKNKDRKDYLFIIVLFLINIWLSSTAGRFLNDFVPVVAIMAGWMTYFIIKRINFKDMSRNIKNAGGGLRGLRKGAKIYHLAGILFISFLVIMPNAFLALDAAIPGAVTKNGTSNMKIDYFGEDHDSAFGSGTYKEQYWVDAFSWLAQQDKDIEENTEKPGFISWWDYGFYASAVGEHPTVADNFQDGIPPAANFHTAKSEYEGVCILIIRLLQGHLSHNGNAFSLDVKTALNKYLGENKTEEIEQWVNDPTKSPSYNDPIGEEYDENTSKELRVGEQYPENAYYHDITDMILENLDDENITWMYHDIQEATGYSIRYYGVEGYDTQIFNIFGFLGDKSLFLHASRKITYLPISADFITANPEDDFIRSNFTGYFADERGNRREEWQGSYNDLMSLSKDEKEELIIEDISTELKDDYYKTMFYNTYVGNVPEELENQVNQLPCWEMKHFHAEYVSPYPYYGSSRSAVIIAKYYEGAMINGTITYKNNPYDAQVVIRKDISLYQNSLLVDHDKSNTQNGTYDLIAPAGNITIEVRKNTELGLNSFILKTITLNNTDNQTLSPITDDESMRKEGTNYQRTIDMDIDPAFVEGHIFDNKDNNTEYNKTVDFPLMNATITLTEIAKFSEEGTPIEFGESIEKTTDENGYYNASDIMPGIYFVRSTYNDFVIHEEYAFIYSNNNTYDIIKPKPSTVNGKIYFDENEDSSYTDSEEMNNVNVELLYTKDNGEDKIVNSLITDESGDYEFASLIPGEYTIKATKENTTTGYLDYYIEEAITLEENKTSTINISIDYADIEISGQTLHGSQSVSNIDIEFLPDMSVENNTAVETVISSDESGNYEGGITPGSYNVTVDQFGENGKYTFEGKLSVIKGQGIETHDVILTKHSVSVSGLTTHNAASVSNITITFEPDMSIDNNTAEAGETKSDIDGEYTIELLPGTYDVTVDEEVNESGQIMQYSYSGSLVVPDDVQATVTYNIALDKQET